LGVLLNFLGQGTGHRPAHQLLVEHPSSECVSHGIGRVRVETGVTSRISTMSVGFLSDPGKHIASSHWRSPFSNSTTSPTST
jgi:hypothetical protein